MFRGWRERSWVYSCGGDLIAGRPVKPRECAAGPDLSRCLRQRPRGGMLGRRRRRTAGGRGRRKFGSLLCRAAWSSSSADAGGFEAPGTVSIPEAREHYVALGCIGAGNVPDKALPPAHQAPQRIHLALKILHLFLQRLDLVAACCQIKFQGCDVFLRDGSSVSSIKTDSQTESIHTSSSPSRDRHTPLR